MSVQTDRELLQLRIVANAASRVCNEPFDVSDTVNDPGEVVPAHLLDELRMELLRLLLLEDDHE